MTVKIHRKLKDILEFYKSEREFLFPYILKMPTDKRKYIKLIDVCNVLVNRNLKIISALAGINKKVTFHMARHSLAFHLKYNTDSIHVIKDVLGHSNTRTTEIYLQSLDDETLDSNLSKIYDKD